MVSLLFLLRGLRTKEDNEKKRKREKRNEIQCIILLRSYLVVLISTEWCHYFERYKINMELMVGPPGLEPGTNTL